MFDKEIEQRKTKIEHEIERQHKDITQCALVTVEDEQNKIPKKGQKAKKKSEKEKRLGFDNTKKTKTLHHRLHLQLCLSQLPSLWSTSILLGTLSHP